MTSTEDDPPAAAPSSPGTILRSPEPDAWRGDPYVAALCALTVRAWVGWEVWTSGPNARGRECPELAPPGTPVETLREMRSRSEAASFERGIYLGETTGALEALALYLGRPLGEADKEGPVWDIAVDWWRAHDPGYWETSDHTPDQAVTAQSLEEMGRAALRHRHQAYPLAPDDRAVIVGALTREHYRRATEEIVASPEEHSEAMGDAVITALRGAGLAYIQCLPPGKEAALLDTMEAALLRCRAQATGQDRVERWEPAMARVKALRSRIEQEET